MLVEIPRVIDIASVITESLQDINVIAYLKIIRRIKDRKRFILKFE